MTSKRLFNIFFYTIAIIFTVYFIVSVFSSSVFTQTIYSEIIEEYSADDYIEIEGIALRDETLLFADTAYQSIRFLQEDGARIAKNSVYAVYNETGIDDVQAQQLSYLNKKLSRLKKTISKSTQYDVLTVDQNIKDSVISFLNQNYHGEYQSALNGFEEIQSAFDQKLLQQEGTSYIKTVIQSLEDQIDLIYTQSGLSEKNLRSPSAGYFYSKVDGYEYLNMNDYEDLTVSAYLSLMEMPPSEVADNCVGKLQHYSYWAFVSSVPSEYAADLYVGKTVYLEFTVENVGTKKISTTVEYISRAQDGINAVRFRCGTLTAELFGLRKETPHMVLKTYTGLKVDNEALRVVDGETGVYVISAQRIVFKPVEIVYVTEQYSLVSSKANTGNRVLKAKDEVVIGGKDLFDGKVVNVTK